MQQQQEQRYGNEKAASIRSSDKDSEVEDGAKNGGAPLVADEIGCGADDRGQVEDCASVTVSSFVLMSLNGTTLSQKSSQQCQC